MTDDRRRRLRLILMLAVTPIAIAGLVLSGKLVSINAFADAADTAFQRRAYAESETQARGLQWWNLVETWKAPFDVGVALGMRGELEESRALLEEALSLHPDEGSNEYCVILTSIVYVVEKQGDAAREADDTQGANGFYQEALGIIDEAPDGCFAEPSQLEADTGEQLEQSVPRIEEKIESEGGGGEEGEEESEGGESEESDPDQPPTQQEQLDEQNQDAQEQQQQQEEYYQQQEEGNEGGGSGVEQPW